MSETIDIGGGAIRGEGCQKSERNAQGPLVGPILFIPKLNDHLLCPRLVVRRGCVRAVCLRTWARA
jgi:hypothetical protein